jgi:catechol 2,3-dioxygenase-like lactoylglutathione lyase family enzyme
MAAITRPHHTGLHVSDLERSLAFYRDLLGFELVFAWNPQAPYIGELVGYPDVDLHAAVVKPPNSDVFLELLEYRNVNQPAAQAQAAAPGTAHTAYYVDGGRAVYLLDPDGIRVELIETKRSFDQYAAEQAR